MAHNRQDLFVHPDLFKNPEDVTVNNTKVSQVLCSLDLSCAGIYRTEF